MTKKDIEMQKLKEYCELRKTLKEYLVSGHKMPTTRREFLTTGLVSSSVYVAAPTLIQMVSASAWGQESGSEISGQCAASGGGGGNGNTRPLFVHIQLAGGPALYAQHAAAGAGGTQLNTQTMGKGSNANIVRAFSNDAPFYANSRFYEQMMAQIGNSVDPELANKTTFTAVAVASIDDNGGNAQDPSGLLVAAGFTGSKLSPTRASNRGNRFRPAVASLGTQMLRVTGSDDLQGALGVSGALGQMSGNADQQLQVHGALARLISDLSKEQVRELASKPNSHKSQQIYKEQIQCAMQQNATNMSEPASVNFLSGNNNLVGINNPQAFQQAFANIQGRNQGERNGIGNACGAGFAGYTNSVTVALGGYDYHNGGARNTAETRDAECGDLVGAIMRGAAAAGKDVFIMVSADGSVNSNAGDSNGTQNWTGDLGTRGMAYFIHYKATGAAVSAQAYNSGGFSDASWQINHFVGNRVNAGPTLGNIQQGSAVLGCAAFVNYASAMGQLSAIDAGPMTPVKTILQNAARSMGAPGNYLDAFVRFRG